MFLSCWKCRDDATLTIFIHIYEAAGSEAWNGGRGGGREGRMKFVEF